MPDPERQARVRLLIEMNSEALIVLIYDALYRLGFRANHTGFFYLSYSVLLCVRADTVQIPAAQLRAEVAWHYGTTPQTVKDQIHAAVTKVWRTDRAQMEHAMGQRLERRPRDEEILTYLYGYITGQDMERQE